MRPYLRIARELGRDINYGMMPAGSRVPPLGELVQRTGHARETCRKALRELERAGMLERRDSRPGYYVTATAGRQCVGDESDEVPGKRSDAQDRHPERGESAMPGSGHRCLAVVGGCGADPVPLVNMFRRAAGSWPAGTDHLRWLVIPVGEKSEQAAGMLTSRHRYLAGCPGLTSVPTRWMHIAVGHIGPVGSLDAGELARLVGLMRERCARLSAFSVKFGPPEMTQAGVICLARPVDELRGLGQLTADALQMVARRTSPALPAAADQPHVVVAYATGSGTTAPAEKVLAERASVAPQTDWVSPHIEVAALRLARVRHDGRRLTWTTVETVPLLGQTGEAENR